MNWIVKSDICISYHFKCVSREVPHSLTLHVNVFIHLFAVLGAFVLISKCFNIPPYYLFDKTPDFFNVFFFHDCH